MTRRLGADGGILDVGSSLGDQFLHFGDLVVAPDQSALDRAGVGLPEGAGSQQEVGRRRRGGGVRREEGQCQAKEGDRDLGSGEGRGQETRAKKAIDRPGRAL